MILCHYHVLVALGPPRAIARDLSVGRCLLEALACIQNTEVILYSFPAAGTSTATGSSSDNNPASAGNTESENSRGSSSLSSCSGLGISSQPENHGPLLRYDMLSAAERREILLEIDKANAEEPLRQAEVTD